MISNLMTAIRDHKGDPFVQGTSTEDKKESTAGFGLIFQTMQEKESNEQGNPQSSLQGQTELAEEGTSAEETETGNVKTKSGSIKLTTQPDTNPVSKASIKLTENAQTAQAEVSQTEGEKEVIDIDKESILPLVNADDLQENSDEITVQNVKKEDGNERKVQLTVQPDPEISSTDGKPEGEVILANNKEKPLNELTINQESAKEQIPDVGGANVSGQSNLAENISAMNTGTTVNPKEITNVSEPEQAQKPVPDMSHTENAKSPADAEQKIPVKTHQENSAAEATTSKPETASPGLADRASILQAEAQNSRPAGLNKAEPIQTNDKVLTKASPEVRVNPQNETPAADNLNTTSGTGRVNTDGLEKPITDIVEDEVPKTKVETPSIEKISIKDADKSVPVTQTKPDVFVTRDGEKIAGSLKNEEVRDLVFRNVEPQKFQSPIQVSETRVPVSEENQEKLVRDISINKEVGYPLENGAVLKKWLANNIREKKYGDRLSGFESRTEDTKAREKIPVDTRNSQQWSGQISSFSNGQFQTGEAMSFSDLKITEDKLPWNKHSVDVTKLKENKAAEQQSAGFSRLMEIPVFNLSVRRNLLPSLTQTVLKAATGNSSLTESWQKHNFSLENGKNLQLSMRQVDGVVYMKLNSTHSELTRLLVQHQDEIRQHLQKECNMEIDLQFEDDGEQDLSQFLDDSPSGKRGWSGKSTITNGKDFVERESQGVQTTIRKFGYNRMEWMA